MAGRRISYRGTALYANTEEMHRVQSFGSTSSFTFEEVSELANRGIVDLVEDIEEVEITIEALNYGLVRDLALLFGKPSDTATIDISPDIDGAVTDIYALVEPPAHTNTGTVWSQYFEDAFLTGISMDYPVDGNFTESYSLVADNKTWLLNAAGLVTSVTQLGGGNGEETFDFSVVEATDVVKVLAVYCNGEKVDKSLITSITYSSATATVKFVDSFKPGAEDTLVCVAACDGKRPAYQGDSAAPAALRRGHIEVEFWRGHGRTGDQGALDTSTGTSIKIPGIQSVSIDVNFDRNNKMELGTLRITDRPVQYPIGVDISIEIEQEGLEAFALAATGKNLSSTEIMSVRDFDTGAGIIIKLFEETDIEGHSSLLKTIQIPYLVPNDEAWNISIDTDATQTFSFRSHAISIGAGA